jgi:hypothetical protein
MTATIYQFPRREMRVVTIVSVDAILDLLKSCCDERETRRAAYDSNMRELARRFDAMMADPDCQALIKARQEHQRTDDVINKLQREDRLTGVARTGRMLTDAEFAALEAETVKLDKAAGATLAGLDREIVAATGASVLRGRRDPPAPPASVLAKSRQGTTLTDDAYQAVLKKRRRLARLHRLTHRPKA